MVAIACILNVQSKLIAVIDNSDGFIHTEVICTETSFDTILICAKLSTLNSAIMDVMKRIDTDFTSCAKFVLSL